LLAGHNGGTRLNAVEFSAIGQSGQLTKWKLTSPLQHARAAAAVVMNEKNIYVLGGMGNNGPLNSVEMAIQFPNGQLGQKTN